MRTVYDGYWLGDSGGFSSLLTPTKRYTGCPFVGIGSRIHGSPSVLVYRSITYPSICETASLPAPCSSQLHIGIANEEAKVSEIMAGILNASRRAAAVPQQKCLAAGFRIEDRLRPCHVHSRIDREAHCRQLGD